MNVCHWIDHHRRIEPWRNFTDRVNDVTCRGCLAWLRKRLP